ncbi:MAG: arylsulfatase [Verrucomicrobia bacterium]|nr:arylsulfatase [Verrucomicrobiota bacterium]
MKIKTVSTIFGTLLLVTALTGNAAPAARPNIIFILADDLGYADLSCFGSKAVQTPHLDALAAGGVKLTQFYAASAVCTPTRASILTGRYPLRFDIRQHFSDDESHLPRGVNTLPKLLKQAGYATAHVGKWHLGGLHQKHFGNRAATIPGPHEHGFDQYLCQIEEQPLRGELGRKRRLYRDGGTCLVRDEKLVTESDPYYRAHLTDIIGDEAVRLVEEFHKQRRPFFLNIWHLVPHTPYEPAPEPYWSRSAAAGISEDQRCFRSMVAHMDAKIGQLLAKLDQLGLRDNTLIVFTSDNGGAYESDIGPLKGGKTDLHEGGIRVPMIASWPKKIPAGESNTTTVGNTVDLLPTFCAAAGVRPPVAAPLDGINLLPCLTGSGVTTARESLFWQLDLYRGLQRHYPKPKPYATEAVRWKKWKLLAKDGDPLELFDLDADIRETNNLLDQHPEVVSEMNGSLRRFLNDPRDRSGAVK